MLLSTSSPCGHLKLGREPGKQMQTTHFLLHVSGHMMRTHNQQTIPWGHAACSALSSVWPWGLQLQSRIQLLADAYEPLTGWTESRHWSEGCDTDQHTSEHLCCPPFGSCTQHLSFSSPSSNSKCYAISFCRHLSHSCMEEIQPGLQHLFAAQS